MILDVQIVYIYPIGFYIPYIPTFHFRFAILVGPEMGQPQKPKMIKVTAVTSKELEPLVSMATESAHFLSGQGLKSWDWGQLPEPLVAVTCPGEPDGTSHAGIQLKPIQDASSFSWILMPVRVLLQVCLIMTDIVIFLCLSIF